MKNNHTPGPWFFSPAVIENRVDIVCSEKQGTIAQNVRIEDARLIAAAPDMLKALKLIITCIQTEDTICLTAKIYDAVVAAKVKAEE